MLMAANRYANRIEILPRPRRVLETVGYSMDAEIYSTLPFAHTAVCPEGSDLSPGISYHGKM